MVEILTSRFGPCCTITHGVIELLVRPIVCRTGEAGLFVPSHEEELGVGDEGPGDRQHLAFAAREFVGAVLPPLAEPRGKPEHAQNATVQVGGLSPAP